MKLDIHPNHSLCSRADCEAWATSYLVFGNTTVFMCSVHALDAYHQLKKDLGLQGQ